MEEEAKPAESTATQVLPAPLSSAEVLPVLHFGTCKPSEEIQEYVKLLMELCKQQMTAETVSATRSKNAPAEKPQDTRAFGKPSESKFPSGVASEKQRAEDGQTQGTYIVGRSAFGWNFIIFVGEEPVYYGITKESF
ncbi:hypothetical protein ACFX11_000678 [Malus domestica]